MPRPKSALTSPLKRVRASLQELQRALDRLAKKARTLELAAATNGSPVRGSPRKLTITLQRRAQLKRQGQYRGPDPAAEAEAEGAGENGEGEGRV